jgi:hypothetical protein
MKRPERNKINLNADKYRKSDKHPSHKGVVDIDGALYWVAGWFNDGEYGSYFKGDFKAVTDEELDKYFSEDMPAKPASKPLPVKPPVVVDDDMDDDLPF